MKLINLWITLTLPLIILASSCKAETTTEPAATIAATLPAVQDEPVAQPSPLASGTAVSLPTKEISQTIRLTPATPAIELVPTLDDTAVTGEVPADLMAAIYTDLATIQSIDKASITIIKAEATVWNDGALGCPQPGEVYTQAIVNGYLIVLAVDGRTYNYHAAENGHFILCQNNLAPSTPIVGTPTS